MHTYHVFAQFLRCLIYLPGAYLIYPGCLFHPPSAYFIYPGCLFYLPRLPYLFTQCVIFICPVCYIYLPSAINPGLGPGPGSDSGTGLGRRGGRGVLFFLIIKSFKCLKFARQGFDLSPERRCTSPCSIASTSTCPPPSPSHLPSLSFVCLASHSKTTTTTIIIRVRRTFFPPSIVPETLGPCSCDPGNSVP